MISKARRDALQEYLEQIRDQLRLQAWDIEVDPNLTAPEGTMLEIKPDPRLWWASVRVGSFFDTHDPNIVNDANEQRRTAIHEMLHLTQADLWWWVFEGDWKVDQPSATAREYTERIQTGLEKTTDFCARAMASLFPMPPEWPD